MARLIILTFLIIKFHGLAYTQDLETVPPYRQYTLKDGLSQMQVMNLFQDSRGYIWIGTKAGLNRFNGESFTSFRMKKDQIASDYIYDIKEDINGNIWASTADGIINLDGEKIVSYNNGALQAAKLAADNEGRIWYITSDPSEKKNHFGYIWKNKIVVLDHLLGPFRFAYYNDVSFSADDKNVLVALDSTLYSVTDDSLLEIYKNKTYITFVPNTLGYAYFSDSENNENFNLKVYRNNSVETAASVLNGKYLHQPEINESLFIIPLYSTPRIVWLSPDSVYYDFYGNLPAFSFLADRDGQLWAGSEEGLYQFFDNGYTTYSKISLPQVWAVTEDLDKNLWFASYVNGISKYENGSLRRFPELSENNSAYFYFHPSLDKQGRVHFPNAYGILTADGERFSQYRESIYLTTFYDKERELLWGGSKKKAVAFDAEGKAIRTIDEHDSLEVGNHVIVIRKDREGKYWFGGGRGAARYDWETGVLKNFKPGNAPVAVRTIKTDHAGRTWFGCDNGLYWHDPRKDTLMKIEMDELSDPVNLLEPIDSTWLIVSQPFGIYLMDLIEYYRSGTVKLYLFNENNGFLGVEPGQDGAFTDSKGNIWMTTSTEVVKLDPEKLKISNNILNIRIITCNSIQLPYDTRNVKLPPDQNSAVITFDAICFSRPNPVEYSWKLESDTDWSEWQGENYAVLSGLSDGKNDVIVRARVPGLPSNETAQAGISIMVKLALYRQPWFFPAIFALFSTLGLIVLAYALLKLKNANRQARISQIQAIQSQMNPHFIFNVLASIQSLILTSKVSQANDYLVKLSELIRGFLEAAVGTGTTKNPQSKEGLIPLTSELNLLNDFVEFQKLINPGKIEYDVFVDPSVNPDKELVPPFLIQPFIENAIRHGILPSARKGHLKLTIDRKSGVLSITIKDNGIGIEKAGLLMKESPMRYTSRGKELTMNRVRLLNQLGFNIKIKTESNAKGTTVGLEFS
jgi:hypothetical protein